ncbi:MAG: hypothetical protein HKO56_06880 [Bacteroidia bacterium]|nr:hypothetical protein [Bacteroidia bacterium]NNC85976.1 hypothetical protein [Bacteroidia bacterium]NNM16364.1 hypothetical protein [Bacteroidia bacterium]
MRKLKALLFIFFSIFLLYRTVLMVNNLWINYSTELSFGKSLLLSFLLNLYITGIFAFPGFVLPTHKLLSKKYYQIKNKKLLIQTYKFLRVDIFRQALLFAFWGSKKNRSKYFNGTKGGLQNFIYQSKQSEFGHIASFIIILALSLALVLKGYVLLSCLAISINILGNFYPVVLQRYHRIRIENILK